MQARHLRSALLALGVLVGAAAVVGLLLGFEPSRLPAALLDVAVYKLTFLAALALLAAGAVVGRHARRADDARAVGTGARPELPGAPLAGGSRSVGPQDRVPGAAASRPEHPPAG